MKMVCFALVLAALGCGGADNPAASGGAGGRPGATGPAPTPAHRERDQLYFDIADRSKAGTCDQFATTLTAWVTEHGPRIRTLEKEINSPVDIDEHLVDAFEAILERASDCVDNDPAQAAFEAFDELFMGG